MAIPLVLLLIATSSAGVVAYGVHPDWSQYAHGLAIIMFSRRLMWPLIAISLISCLSLLGLVISGKKRAWWLIGLAPVLALFFHRFGPGSAGPTAVVEMPPMVDANGTGVPEAGDYVVGLIFSDRPYAFPYRALYARPVISLIDYDKRMLLVWSAFANRAVAVNLTRELRARDLEVVSHPVNSLLIYDGRLGQFISGVTGKLVNDKDVVGFSKPIPTAKVTWSAWRARHPDTVVMTGWNDKSYPNVPILPQFKIPVPPNPDPLTQISLLATTQPAAVRDDALLAQPANLTIGNTRVLLIRDRFGRLRAFDRHLREDLFLTFQPAKKSAKRDAILMDVDSQSVWTSEGMAVDGPLKGQRLHEIEVDDRLYWGVMKYWYPKLELIDVGNR
jgi:Protein of unknown function (DUF3179)